MIVFLSISPFLIRTLDNFKEHLDCKKFLGTPLIELFMACELCLTQILLAQGLLVGKL